MAFKGIGNLFSSSSNKKKQKDHAISSTSAAPIQIQRHHSNHNDNDAEAQRDSHPTKKSSKTNLLQKPADGRATPLPRKQLLVICLMRLSEPIALTFVFPFISDYLWDLKTTNDRSKLGMYAGIIESVFAIIQTLTVLQWARASDRIGRKPILLVGCLGSSLSVLLFGLAPSFPLLILARSLAGALNGNVAIFKAVLAELTDRSNTARAFSFLALMWTTGITIGPMIGGYLSKPAERYPSVFSTAQNGPLAFGGLWEHKPYFLPCVIAALLTLASMTLGFFFLEETLPSKVAAKEEAERKKKREQRLLQRQRLAAEGHGEGDERTPLLTPSGGSTPANYTPDAVLSAEEEEAEEEANNSTPPQEEQQLGVWDLLKIPHIRRVMISYAVLAFSFISLDAVQVLYFWEPVSVGGLSFPAPITGTIMSFASSIGIFSQLFAFPYLVKRIGALSLFKAALFGYFLCPSIMPFANVFARAGLPAGAVEHQGGFMQDIKDPFRTLVLITVATGRVIGTLGGGLAFSSNMLIVNHAAAVAPGVPMGTLNGLAQMASGSMIAVGPYTASTFYALTLEYKLLGGFLIWPILVVIGILGRLSTRGMLDIEKMIDRGEISPDAANRRS